MPPSVWFFARANTDETFEFHRRHLLYYLPAGLDVLIQGIIYFRFIITGHFLYLLGYDVWFIFAEVLPILWMTVVLYNYWRRLVGFSHQITGLFSSRDPLHIIKLYSLFTFFSLLTILWFAAVIAELDVFATIELILATFLFVLGYIGYLKPAFFDIPQIIKSRSAELPAFNNTTTGNN